MIAAARKLIPPIAKGPLVSAYNWLCELRPARVAARRWVKNQYTAHNQKLRSDLFLTIANFAHMNRPIRGYYMEFGCHGGNTMRLAWDNFRYLFDWHFIGFDSFKGLPKIGAIDRQEIWQEGRLRTQEADFIAICRRHGIPLDRISTVAGFYSDSLTPDIRARFPGKAAVVYVDCDLYESTVAVLGFIKDYLQPGTIIVFDDWNCFRADPDRGERRAWREFQQRHPELKFEPLTENGLQAAFVCVR